MVLLTLEIKCSVFNYVNFIRENPFSFAVVSPDPIDNEGSPCHLW